MGTEIREKKPFGISGEQLRQPISPEVLRAFGIADDANQEDLGLAQVVIEGGSYGGGRTWSIGFHSPSVEGEVVNFGEITVNSDDGAPLSSEQVLYAADQWVRESETTEWVPGRALAFQIPEDQKPYLVGGLILVRATDIEHQ